TATSVGITASYLGVSQTAFLTVNPAPAPVPSITSVSPSSGVAGTSVPVVITGTGFQGGSLAISGTGVAVTGGQVTSSTQVNATLAIASTAAAGARSLTVTTPGGTSNAATFTVTLSASGLPVITSITPASGLRGTAVTITINGSNFLPGATVG